MIIRAQSDPPDFTTRSFIVNLSFFVFFLQKAKKGKATKNIKNKGGGSQIISYTQYFQLGGSTLAMPI